MERVKKFSLQTIAIVVLSVLLAISVTVGGTMAWFASYTTAEDDVTIGEGIYVKLTNGATYTTGTAMDITGENLTPNGFVTSQIWASMKKSTTHGMLRMKISITSSLDDDDLNAQLEDEFNAQVRFAAAQNGWYLVTTAGVTDLGYYYFTGVAYTGSATEFAALAETAKGMSATMTLAAVDNTDADSQVRFLDTETAATTANVGTTGKAQGVKNAFRLPSSNAWSNAIEKATITFTFRCESLQANFVDASEKEALSGDGLTEGLTVTYAESKAAFEQAFDGTTEDNAAYKSDSATATKTAA